jgi:uncharacterized membrane protein YecN with MAPEG domain
MTAHALLVSPLYVGFFALMLVVLGIGVIRLRGKRRVQFGDGGHLDLQRAMRIHGNFAEYVPFALLVILLIEAAGYSRYWIHLLGLALVAARLLHAWGLTRDKQPSSGRVIGMTLTFTVLAVGSVLLIVDFARNAALM